MRKIIRNQSCEVCPSGYIWIVWVTQSTASSSGTPTVKLIYPAGADQKNIEDEIKKRLSTNASIIRIDEVSIQG
jgi:hypothetical protein|nr:MAG TPA: Translation initiation factor SUI1 [Caudoviricetes sp.]